MPDARYSRGFAVGGWAGISSTSTASVDSVTNPLTLMNHPASERRSTLTARHMFSLRCFRCEREVQDTDIRWCNPVKGLVVDAAGVLRMALLEYDEDPGKADPGAAPYCSTCRADLDEGD